MKITIKVFPTLLLFASVLLIANCTIIITQPAKTPFQNNTFQYAYANFGNISYGKPNSFELVHVDNNLCQIGELPHFNTSVYVITDDTGSCTYTQKARTVQALGGKGLIIGSEIFNYYDKIVPSSDINGRKVHIAVLFVSKSTYKNLLSLKNVEIKVNFTIVQKQKSQITLFLQSASRATYIFLREFKPYYDKLKNSIKLQLIYFTTPCSFCDSNDCILGQKYCAFDMQYYNFGVGSNIVKEQLKQYDIYTKYGADKWFQYMNQFDESCDFDWRSVAQCSDQIQKKIGISEDLATVNMESVMKSWKEKQTNYSFISPPELAINGLLNPGNLEGKLVYQSICSSLINGCQKQQQEPNPQKPLSLTFIIFAIMIGALIILTIGFFIYKKFIAKELTNDMSSKVNELVAKYASKVNEMKKKRKSRMVQKLNEEL